MRVRDYLLQEDIDKEFKSLVDTIADMTDNNEHTEALIELARYIGEDSIEKKLQDILRTQNKVGHLPDDLMRKRESLRKPLMDAASARFDKNQMRKLQGAY